MSEPSGDPLMRVLLVDLDISSDPPVPDLSIDKSPFHEKRLHRVPVVRIWGITPAGQRVLVNVHGAWNYFYVEWPEKQSLQPDLANEFIRRFGITLDRVLSDAMAGDHKKTSSSRNPTVAFVVTCRATSVYGCHVEPQAFLKIYLVSHRYKKKACSLLRHGAVMRTVFKHVYEEHIPFGLQFMADLGMTGAGWVDVRKGKFRRPLPDDPDDLTSSDPLSSPTSITSSHSKRRFTVSTVPDRLVYPSSSNLGKVVHQASIEIDVAIDDVGSWSLSDERNIHENFSEYFSNLEGEDRSNPKLVRTLKELWEDEAKRRAGRGEKAPDPGPGFLQDGPRRTWQEMDSTGNPPQWGREKAHRANIATLAAEDLARFQAQKGHEGSERAQEPTFASFLDKNERAKGTVQQSRWLRTIPTSYQQTNATWRTRLEADERARPPPQWAAWSCNGTGVPSLQHDEADIDKAAFAAATQAFKTTGGGAEGNEGGEGGLGEIPEADEEDEDFRDLPDGDGFLQDSDDDESDSDLLDDELAGGQGDPQRAPRRSPTRSPSTRRRPLETESSPAASPSQSPAEGRPSKRGRTLSPLSSASPAAPAETTPSRAAVPSPRRAVNLFARKPAQVTFTADSEMATTWAEEGGDQAATDDAMEVDEDELPSPEGRLASQESVSKEVEKESQDWSMPSPTVVDIQPSVLRSSSDSTDSDDVSWRLALVQNAGKQQLGDDSPTPSSSSSAAGLLARRTQSGTAPPNEPAASASDVVPDSQEKAQSEQASQPPAPSPLRRVTFAEPERSPPPATHISIVDDTTEDAIVISSNTSNSIKSDSSLPAIPRPPSNSEDDSSVSSFAVLRRTSTHPLARRAYRFALLPPLPSTLFDTIESYGKSRFAWRDPYYSTVTDVPQHAREFGGRTFKWKGSSLGDLPEFHEQPRSGEQDTSHSSSLRVFRFAPNPPSSVAIEEWLTAEQSAEPRPIFIGHSQIDPGTQANGGFQPMKRGEDESKEEQTHIGVFTMEIHVNTRGHLLPDPAKDAIVAVAWCFQCDDADLVSNSRGPHRRVGVVAVDPDEKLSHEPTSYELRLVKDEASLIDVFLDIFLECNPEIVAGYQIQKSSFGYFVKRASLAHDWNILPHLGRVGGSRFKDKSNDRYNYEHASTLHLTGRIVYPIWRILAGDTKFIQYTFEHVASQILKRRVPCYSHETLTKWHTSGKCRLMSRVLGHLADRAEMDMELLDGAETVSQNSEFARVFGVDFRSVRTRGSQFKVESVMLRIVKPESVLLLAPTREEVGKQNAAEAMPLIMEPKSAFYKGPLLVLDFQSLYPSVMIAYNLCYTTCLGRIGTFKGEHKLGVSDLKLPAGFLALAKDHINVTPNGFMFLKPHVRRSMLAKMLNEILETRVMIKDSMAKAPKDANGQHDKGLQKLLNARQLGLKLLANVTYGYTSATFSGRMPCVEIADSIVQIGRETLERALKLIGSREDWGAEVVYGDTDSLFVYLPGKTKEDGFRIGKEIADAVTDMNPPPVKLKFEKVYLPCVLLAKKRYVGFKYEKLSEKEPEMDAKGIEIIRRDGIPATQKIQEACLKILFRSQDLSEVKRYLLLQWQKIFSGDVSIQDFTYAKEVKPGKYKAAVLPPGVVVAAHKTERDKQAEPDYGERVPYVIIQGDAGSRQVDRAVAPDDVLRDPRLRLDAKHYIEKAIIPPLERIFNLLGVDVWAWYKAMPKTVKVHKVSKSGLEEHWSSGRCLLCDRPRQDADTDSRLCKGCTDQPQSTVYKLAAREREIKQRHLAIQDTCRSCSGIAPWEQVTCESLDCPVLYSRKKAEAQLGEAEVCVEELNKL